MNTIPKISIKIGGRLLKLRMDKGYKQEYMAEVLKVSQKTYSNIENGKSSISIDTLEKIAEEYKINFLELLSEEPVVLLQNNYPSSSSKIFMNYNLEILLNQMKEQIEDLKLIIAQKDIRKDIVETSLKNIAFK